MTAKKPRQKPPEGRLDTQPLGSAGNPDNQFPDTLASDAIEAINSLANGGDAEDFKIGVFRVTGSFKLGASMPWLFDIEPSLLPELREKLAELYPGGGKFRVVATRSNKFFRAFSIEIEARPGYKAPNPFMPAPQNNPQTDNQQSGLMLFLQEMRSENQKFMMLIADKLSQGAAIAKDPVEDLQKTLTMMKTMQDLMPKQDPDAGMKMFDKVMEMANKVAEATGGGASDGGGIFGAIKSLADSEFGKAAGSVLGNVVANAQQQTPQQPAQERIAPPVILAPAPSNPGVQHRPTPNPMPAPQQQQQPAPGIFDLSQLDQAIPYLVDRAASGTDPKFIAEWIEANVPNKILAELEEQEDIVSFLWDRYPQIEPHRDWFQSVVDIIWAEEELSDETQAVAAPSVATGATASIP